MSYEIKMCDCGKETVYAQGLGRSCYLKRWRKTTTAPIPHGRPATYSNRGCRCQPCVDAKRAYMREYKARRKAEG